MLEKFLVIGAGGQGKVVIDMLRSTGLAYDLLLADDDVSKQDMLVLGLTVIAPVRSALTGVRTIHVAIGDNLIRERVTQELISLGLHHPALTHPRAAIATSAQLGAGAFVAAQAVIGPDAMLAIGAIVNHGAIVDHDCEVGQFSHIAPGATLAGAVRIGARVLIGAGANILPGVSIGDDCVIAAGAVVLRDVAAGSMVAGVPARRIK